jgi:hypothetical protein
LLRCNTVLNKKLLKILDDCLEASGRPTHFLDTTIRRATCMCLSILPFSLVDFVATRASIHVSYVRFHSITWKRSRRPTTTRNLHELLTEKDMNETERGIQGISNRIHTFLRNHAPSLANMSKRKCVKTHIFNSSCVIVAHAWDALLLCLLLVAPQWASIFNFNKGA